MCGIAGAVRASGGLTADQTRAMAAVLAHRGPDGEGVHLAPGHEAGLGHRRLAIIDLATGQQPMSNEDGSVWIAFNGEIYNEPDLRPGLVQKGHVFKTHSDTEAIVHLYEEEGEHCVRRLRGMFAFAIWDARRRRLLLACDRVGKKPLFFAQWGDTFLFGSELKALLAFPGFAPEVDWSFLDAYLALGYIPAPRTPFRGVHKLSPAHVLVLDEGKAPRVSPYWEPSFAKRPMSEGEALEELDHRLREAVRIRLRSDVPFGAFLSGGVDSGTIVALMSRQLASPVKTFSVGFEEDGYNELPYAREVARLAGTEHHEMVVRMGDLSILPSLARSLDEPFADASALPTYHVSRAAAAHVRMALSGDGGDELFGGYARYRKELLLRLATPVTAALRPFRRALARQVLSGRRAQRLTGIAYHAAQPFGASYETAVGLLTPEARRAVLANGAGREWWLADWFRRYEDLDPGDRMMAVDMGSYLPGDILVKVDRMSMACSLEVRAPLLDHELLEFAAALPVSLKVTRRGGKHLLRRYAETLLPPALVNRRKQGFAIPLDQWFRGDASRMLREVLDAERDVVDGLFRRHTILRWLEDHRQGLASHGERLWAILMVLLWHQVVVRRS